VSHRAAALTVLGLARVLEHEKWRRSELGRPGPLEAKPVSVLGLHWSAQLRLTVAAIDSVGQLLQTSEQDLLRLKGFGVKRLRHVQYRLWELTGRTLKGSAAPAPDQLDDPYFGTLLGLWLPLDISAGVSGLPDAAMIVALSATAVVVRHLYRHRGHLGHYRSLARAA